MSLNQEKLITIDANMSTIFGEVISRGGNCVWNTLEFIK